MYCCSEIRPVIPFPLDTGRHRTGKVGHEINKEEIYKTQIMEYPRSSNSSMDINKARGAKAKVSKPRPRPETCKAKATDPRPRPRMRK